MSLVQPINAPDAVPEDNPLSANPLDISQPVSSERPMSYFMQLVARQKQHNVQMATKVYFWHNPTTGHILQGAPPPFQPIRGYQVVECNHAHEAERWSARLNEQDKRDEMITKEQRDAEEAVQVADLRKNIQHLLKNATSELNASMLKFALLKCDVLDEKRRRRNNTSHKDTFLHSEAFEAGN